MADGHGSQPAPGEATERISRDVVGIYAKSYGRGPTKARTLWDRDLVLVRLEDLFTPSEQTLIESGYFDQVRAQREAFQDAVEPLLRKAVSEATGRSVRTFLSAVSAHDVACEIFVLDGGDG